MSTEYSTKKIANYIHFYGKCSNCGMLAVKVLTVGVTRTKAKEYVDTTLRGHDCGGYKKMLKNIAEYDAKYRRKY